jgi:hypothetical protein
VFQQIYPVSGTNLPIWGATVECYYQGGTNLSKIRSTTIPPAAIKVSGEPADMSSEEIKAIVAQQLGLRGTAASKIESCTRGVYLPEHNPTNAVVAYRLHVSAGDSHEPISVFYDPASGKIMKIE